MKGMIIIDVARCLGCRSCELACAVEHSQSRDLQQAVNETPAPRPRVSVQQAAQFAVPLQCRHCEDAPCVAICPTKALGRTDADGPVLINSARCIGCTWCVLACPFGVISFDPARRAIIKCDQCFERVGRGELPACVSACPTGALSFRSLDDAVKDKRAACLLQIERGLTGDQR